MVAVSVVVPVVDDFERLKDLVRSLDLQTLPSDAFEVVLGGAGGEVTTDQLEALAAHRPNMRVRTPADPGSDLLAAAAGDFVLVAEQDETWFPEALARLRDFVEQHGADAVVARVATPGMAVPAPLWTDTDALDEADLAAALAGPAGAAPGRLVVRRSLAELTDAGLRPTADVRVGALGSYAVVRRSGGPAETSTAEPATTAPTATVETAEWQGGTLHLVLRAAVPDAGPAPRGVLQLRHAETAAAFLVPAEVSATEPSADGSTAAGLLVEATVDPLATPTAGEPLAAGRWHVELLLAGDGADRSPVAVPWSACPPALIGTTAVVPAPVGPADGSATLTLDVGPLHSPLVTGLDPSDATITESVVGSELVLDLPGLHVSDSDGVDGALALGKMRIPARIRVRDGRAQLVALVSGLAGNTTLSAQFGPGPLRPTGLSLHITGVGAMTVIRTPPPAPKPAPAPAKPASAPKPAGPARAKRKKRRKKVEPPRTGVVADLRRAVPAPLEPVVRRLSEMPAARRLYRRVTR